MPYSVVHHARARHPASSRVLTFSPAEQSSRVDWTARSTRPLSRGARTRVGSMKKPRFWAYSWKVMLMTGWSGSAMFTIALVLSGLCALPGYVPEPTEASAPCGSRARKREHNPSQTLNTFEEFRGPPPDRTFRDVPLTIPTWL